MADQIILENVHGLAIKSGMTLESIISQLQPLIQNVILCVKNHKSIVIYKDKSEFPLGLRLEKVIDDIFHIRSIVDDDLYIVAGKETASLIFPGITNGGMRYASINNMGNVSSEIINSQPIAKIRKYPLV